MVVCAAFECYVRSGTGVSLFKFPKDATARTIWTDRINRPGYQPNENSRLCEKHFSDSDILFVNVGSNPRPRLKPGAVPSVFTPEGRRIDGTRKRVGVAADESETLVAAKRIPLPVSITTSTSVTTSAKMTCMPQVSASSTCYQPIVSHRPVMTVLRYVDELMREVLETRFVQDSYREARQRRAREDRRPVPLSQSTPRLRSKHEVVAAHIHRFNR